jgi:hypothetical protein
MESLIVRAIGSRIMDNYIKPLGVKKQLNPSNSLYLLWINISKEQLLDKLLIFIKVVVEYAFGMHIGYAIGWLIGLYVGHSYVEYFEPVYLDDLSQLSSLLSYWRSMPYIFARYGAMIGVAIGVIAIAIINNNLLNQRVTSLYKEGITNSNDIARHLCESVGQIERKINRLVKKGRISQTTILEGN